MLEKLAKKRKDFSLLLSRDERFELAIEVNYKTFQKMNRLVDEDMNTVNALLKEIIIRGVKRRKLA